MSTAVQGRAVAPHIYFLWDGVPFDQLALSAHVVSASFGATVGKAKGQFAATGAPKVSTANIVFKLDSRVFARHLYNLLLVKQRPVISVAAGHNDGKMYWLGSWKLDKTAWKYGADSVNQITLTGQTDKTMAMAETTKPRVYIRQTVREIFDNLAAHHNLDLELDLTGEALNARVDMFKTSQESDWAFMSRLAADAGAASFHISEDHSRLSADMHAALVRGETAGAGGVDLLAAKQALGAQFVRQATRATAKKILRISSKRLLHAAVRTESLSLGMESL